MRTALQIYIITITNACIMYLALAVGVLCKGIATKNQNNFSNINMFLYKKNIRGIVNNYVFDKVKNL